jgi:hypothetical protein
MKAFRSMVVVEILGRAPILPPPLEPDGDATRLLLQGRAAEPVDEPASENPPAKNRRRE